MALELKRRPGGSLLWRLLVSTSVALITVFAFTGWTVQTYAAKVSQRSLEEEVRTSLKAYQSLWSARVHNLMAISRVLSSMSDVRAAFMTHDQATIRDTAGQLWAQISEENASFLVLDPAGAVITSLGGDPDIPVSASLIAATRARFPAQVSGYLRRGARLYYAVFTPVYVQASHEQALLNILLAAFDITDSLAGSLKRSTHGSEFAFVGPDVVFASTMPALAANDLVHLHNRESGETPRRLALSGTDDLLLETDLKDPLGTPVGKLVILRSFGSQEAVVNELKRNVAVLWGAAIFLAVGLTYLLARRILEPVQRLDQAVGQVIRRNYDYRVPVEANDELGRLALAFNTMCESIQNAREELVRQEQIATIGRLSGSIVHDLRNPLAAIYGGAEMLVDAELSPEQQRKLAVSIYAASRRIQQLLQELVDVSRAKTKRTELCTVSEIAACALEAVGRAAETQSVELATDIPPEMRIVCDRDRLQRVFLNLINNSLDAMPNGGWLRIIARREDEHAVVEVEDSGPGIPREAWPRLFQPFASFGKKNGLGLGLALSRQTLLDHSGDLWADEKTHTGERFFMSLPLASRDAVARS